MVESQVAGDASGGNAIVSVTGDPRYTNVIALVNHKISSAAAASTFVDTISDRSTPIQPAVTICGTTPFATGHATSQFLWYPPPMYYPGRGFAQFVCLNVDVTEVYTIVVQMYCFDIDIRRLTPLPFLQMNVPGVSATSAI